ncbi:MAG: glycosyltransferase [Actinomycetota bacterium]|nr:glycosyltransferase [Actinomycetota bacterium]
MTGQPTGAGPVVSVVVAAYQVERWIGRFLDSVLAQTLDPAAVELVVVDDGSTDGTGALLDAFAADRPGVVVVHQANSGGPGGPRNTGVRLSRGEFLFFADPDDVLAPDGLELLVAAARRNDADVVLGRLVGVGRSAPRAPFAADVERGDVWSTRAVWSLSAQKLFRRDLVVENGLRFVEGLRYAEDQEFVLGAYLAARRSRSSRAGPAPTSCCARTPATPPEPWPTPPPCTASSTGRSASSRPASRPARAATTSSSGSSRSRCSSRCSGTTCWG